MATNNRQLIIIIIRGAEAGGILGVNTPHFLDLVKKLSIFHSQ